MVKDIVKDPFILMQKSKPATKDDLYIVDDLIYTLRDYQRKTINALSKMKCVGMAANMIGESKTILIAGEEPGNRCTCHC